MSPTEGIGLLLLLALVAFYALVQRERDMPEEQREARRAAELAREAAAEADPELGTPPHQPSDPDEWAVLIDTASEGRLADDELLYLEAVLREEGIATRFEPWRPGEHFGQIGPQYPLRLMVDAALADEARRILLELFSQTGTRNWQVRLNNPVMNVPGARDEMMFYAGLRRRAAQGGVWRWIWTILVIMIALGLLRNVRLW